MENETNLLPAPAGDGVTTPSNVNVSTEPFNGSNPVVQKTQDGVVAAQPLAGEPPAPQGPVAPVKLQEMNTPWPEFVRGLNWFETSLYIFLTVVGFTATWFYIDKMKEKQKFYVQLSGELASLKSDMINSKTDKNDPGVTDVFSQG